MRAKYFASAGFFVLFCLLVLPGVFSSFSGLRLQPNSTAYEPGYYVLGVSQLEAFYNPSVIPLQGWHGSLYYDGVVNLSMPAAVSFYSFDYDYLEGNYIVPPRTVSYAGSWVGDGDGSMWDYDTSTGQQSGSGTVYATLTYDSEGVSKLYAYYGKSGATEVEEWYDIPSSCLEYSGGLEVRLSSTDNNALSIACTNSTGQHVFYSGSLCATCDEIYEVGAYSNNYVRDVSSAAEDNYATRKNMFENGIVLYLSMDDYNSTHVFDWGPYDTNVLNREPGYITHTDYGYLAGAFAFAGISEAGDNQFLQVPTVDRSHITPPNETFSFSLWAKVEGENIHDGNQKALSSKGDGTPSYDQWQLAYYTSNQWVLGIKNWSYTSPEFKEVYETGTTDFGEWTHLVGIWNGTHAILYKNGVLQSSVYLSSTHEATGAFTIGANTGGDFSYANEFNGTIDEVYVFNRSISQSEIERLYEVGCHRGYCYDFDGTDDHFINVSGADIIIPANQSHSVSVWSKIVVPDADTSPDHLWGFNGTGYLKLYQSAGVRRYLHYSENWDGSAAPYLDYVVDDAIKRDWIHTIITFNGSVCTAYVNGEFIQQKACHGSSERRFASIGSVQDGGGAWNGSIDDVMVFNTSLSAEQVGILYRSQLLNDSLFLLDSLSNGSYSVNVSVWDSFSVSGYSNVSVLDFASVNLSFFDEDSGSVVSDVEGVLSAGNFSLDFSTSSGWVFIDGLVAGDYDVQYSSLPDFPSRYRSVSVDPVFPTQDFSLYLANSSSSVTFAVENSFDSSVVAGASATMFRSVGGSLVPVASSSTDVTGRVSFSYESDVSYSFLFSKDGFSDLYFSLSPILYSEYDLVMEPTVFINESLDFDDLSVFWEPKVFYDGREHNFSFLVVSPYSDLSAYGFNLSFPGGVASAAGSEGAGSLLNASFTISGAEFDDRVFLRFYYVSDLAGYREFSRSYAIITNSSSGFISGAGADRYGLGLLERILIAVIPALIAAGVGAWIGQREAGFVIGLLWFVACAYVGVVSLWAVVVPLVLGAGLLIMGWDRG